MKKNGLVFLMIPAFALTSCGGGGGYEAFKKKAEEVTVTTPFKYAQMLTYLKSTLYKVEQTVFTVFRYDETAKSYVEVNLGDELPVTILGNSGSEEGTYQYQEGETVPSVSANMGNHDNDENSKYAYKDSLPNYASYTWGKPESKNGWHLAQPGKSIKDDNEFLKPEEGSSKKYTYKDLTVLITEGTALEEFYNFRIGSQGFLQYHYYYHAPNGLEIFQRVYYGNSFSLKRESNAVILKISDTLL